MALRAGKLLLSEIRDCLRERRTFALESTLNGHAQVAILEQAKAGGYRIEIYYLWLPSPAVAIRRIAQRVKKGGHHIPSDSVRRRYQRSLRNFVAIFAPLADVWHVWFNENRPAILTISSERANLTHLEAFLTAVKAKAEKASKLAPSELTAAEARGYAAAKAMSKALRAEHKRWNMPFVSWKDGKIVMIKP